MNTSQNSKLKTQNFSLKLKALSFWVMALSFTLLALSVKTALAQTPPSGISVTPSIAHIDLSQDPPEYELKYTNNTNSEITLNFSVQNFNELEEGYKINFLSGKDASNYKYSLSSWISFGTRSIQLSPKEERSVKIFIDKARITKGGHYASILAEIAQPENKNQVSVKAVLSSLLFVRASTGQEIEDGLISTFKPLRDGIEYPGSYMLRFENNGNVQVVPYGTIEVFDPFDNLVAKGILNEGSLDALPESVRRYDTKVTTHQSVLVPGFYKAVLSMHFGKTDKKLTQEVKFFTLGSFDPIKIGLGFIILISLFVYFRRRKIGSRKNK